MDPNLHIIALATVLAMPVAAHSPAPRARAHRTPSVHLQAPACHSCCLRALLLQRSLGLARSCYLAPLDRHHTRRAMHPRRQACSPHVLARYAAIALTLSIAVLAGHRAMDLGEGEGIMKNEEQGRENER